MPSRRIRKDYRNANWRARTCCINSVLHPGSRKWGRGLHDAALFVELAKERRILPMLSRCMGVMRCPQRLQSVGRSEETWR